MPVVLPAEEWVRNLLLLHLPWLGAEPDEYASELLAIADDYDVPTEAVGDWIQFDTAGKDWSPSGFATWCSKWRETYDRLHPPRTQLCEQCSLPLVKRRRTWLCVHCGLVRLTV